ncbi:hypothetical protein DL95DRAFT_470262 [Leptodontidium sp. 2 PMI_412]|nr:hypothetical protein DL95DRAFT_470262 [Leptodontidium sp. 2 PMI_412]
MLTRIVGEVRFEGPVWDPRRQISHFGWHADPGGIHRGQEEARVKRAAKDAAKDAKGKGKRSRKRRSATPEVDASTSVKAKRGRKRKSALPEADAPEPNIKVARMSKAPLPETARASMVQMTGTRAAKDDIVPGSWRAPVARMY